MCYFELLINSLNLAKIIDGSKTLVMRGCITKMSSSSRIIDDSKTCCSKLMRRNMSSSSKIIDGSKTSN